MAILKYIAIAIIGYLLGNISAGVIIARFFGVNDVRKYGSGGSGTTNVLRTVGWLPSVLTLLCDCLKGFVAAELGRLIGGETGMLLGAFFAIVGHDFPVFLGFKGGKGIATSLALILVINPWLGLAELVAVILVVAITRYMSIASLIAAVAFPVFTAIICRGREYYTLYLVFACMAAALAIFQHRGNIKRLLAGEENRLDFDKISKVSEKVMQRMQKKNK